MKHSNVFFLSSNVITQNYYYAKIHYSLDNINPCNRRIILDITGNGMALYNYILKFAYGSYIF